MTTGPALVELAAGDLLVRLCPGVGGTIASFERRGGGRTVPILLGIPTDELSLATADRAACFPMVPFANRAPGNVLRVGQASYRVLPNTAEPFALHGCGWKTRWQVAAQGEDQLDMVMHASATDYPFAFAARQIFRLSPEGLNVVLSLTNTHHEPIPVGMGLHPYFPRTPATTIRFAAKRFWLEGPGYLPTDAIAIPAELDFAHPRPVPPRWRNNCYSGWNGEAEIVQPDLGYRLTMRASPLFSDLMLFTPPGAPSFALEPQSHTSAATDTAALVDPARPLLLLQPGQSVAGDLDFHVSSYHTA